MADGHTLTSEDPLAGSDASEAEVRTFLISDVRGYTAFTQRNGDEAAAALASEFVRLCRKIVAARGGQVVELRGDEVLAVFLSPRAALRAALDLQRSARLKNEENPELPLRFGIGIDAGEAVPFEGGFRGRALNLASRLCSAARAGEVLVSETVIALAGQIPGMTYGMLRAQRLKGFTEPIPFARVWSTEDDNDGQVSGAPSGEGEQFSNGPTSRLPTGGFLGARPESDLVGQDETVQRLHAAIEAVAAGTGRTLLLSGEPGIGKTRLAQEIGSKALEAGFLVAAATCYEQRQTSPLLGFRELLRILVEEYAGWTELRDRWPVIARLFAGVNDSGVVEEPRDGDRDQLFEAIADFVESVAEGQTTTLMLDDLQWSDVSSLELFVYLSRRTRSRPVLMVGTYRDSDLEAGQPVANAVYDLERQGLVDRVAIQKLNTIQAAALISQSIDGEVSEDVVSMLHESTEGNPFFIKEMLHALIEQGDICKEGSRWIAPHPRTIRVPARVRTLVDRRLLGLSADERALLCEASVLGPVFSFSDLRTISGRSEELIESALETAMSLGVIREKDADHFIFVQTLTRQTLYNSLTGRKRRRLHMAAGEAMARASTDSTSNVPRPMPSEVAWHYLQAEDARRALPFAIEAGEEAESIGAYSEAELQYRTALELTGLDNDDPGAAGILERLAIVLKTLGRYHESLEISERAVQLYEALGNLEGQRRGIALVGLLQLQLDRPQDGLVRLAPMLEQSAHAAPSSGLARLYGTEAQLLLASGRHQAGGKAAQQASDIARAAGDTRTEVESEVYRGEAEGLLGNFDAARQILESAANRASELDLATVARALNGVGTALFYAGKFGQRTTYHRRSVEFARRSNDPRALAGALNALASSLIFIGEWHAAAESATEALHIAQRSNIAVRAQDSRMTLAYISLLRGDPIGSIEPPVQGVPASAHARLIADFWVVARAARYVIDGEFDRALRDLQQNVAGPAVAGWHAGFRALTEASAHLGLGDIAEADRLVEQTASEAMRQHSRPTLAEALMIRGAIRVAEARWDEAERLLQASRTLALEMPYPYVVAGGLLHTAELRRQQGEIAESRRMVDNALTIFRKLGARPNIRLLLTSVAGSALS
ncbi:MAG TPA: BREX system ATP-binding domain-containing protein [Chloroflexota bacterium]